ncbi:MAG: HD domain-containing protein [Planctomycetes bacterium]|uniref:HD domain-containing phosphohydrolase n=1 Tax=Candidatus Wunengus sp. YC65 TaxID=3367701 RepID=UPI001E1A61A7|nr:HD domain-containing protein [Planctomycetota bacterium]
MRNSIVTKIFISFLLVSLLPMVALIAYNDWANRRLIYSMKTAELKNQASKIARIIDFQTIHKKSMIQGVCSKHLIRAADKETSAFLVKSRMKRLLNHFASSESIFILDTHGDIIVANTHDIQTKNYSARDFFKEAVNGNTYVSEPAMDQGEGYIYYSTPVRNYKKEIIGVMVMRRHAEELWKLIEEEKNSLGKGSLCILTDRYGVRIAHATDRSLVFKSWIKLDPGIKKNLETEYYYGEDIKEIGFTEIPEVSEALAQNAGGIFVHPLVISTEAYLGYCMPLKEKDWRLLYTVPASAFLAQIKHLTRNAVLSTGVVFVVVIVLAWQLSVSLARPVKNLTSAANAIANGNLDFPIIHRQQQHEVGVLMQSFEVMRHKIKDSYKELKDANIEALLMLARACEVRDEDTGNHVLRINYYSMALAKELGLKESFIKELGPSSILHDVGKIHIPDYILKKQGYFTNKEREEMKKHPLYGDRILGDSEFFHLAKEIARWHHENFDGTGYPDRLKGEAIPISARIVRLADTYDALVSKRRYKSAWSDQQAYNQIVDHSGTYFDPLVVEAFKRLFERGDIREIKNRYT